MAISPIGAGAGITPIEFPRIDTGNKAGGGADFGGKLTDALEGVQKQQGEADGLALKAATGELNDISDYMIAANKASIATKLTVAVKNKAVESFNQIMNMQV